MSNAAKTALLVAVIVICLGFVVYRLARGSGSGAGGGPAEGASEAQRDLYCLECKEHYTAALKREEYGPLFMAGTNAATKHTCPKCGKQAGVAAVKCKACGEWVPSPGTQGMNRPGMGGPAGARGPAAPVCPKCKKPLEMPRFPGGDAAPAQ